MRLSPIAQTFAGSSTASEFRKKKLKVKAPSIAEQRDGSKPRLSPATIIRTTNTSDRLGIVTLVSKPTATTVAAAVIR